MKYRMLPMVSFSRIDVTLAKFVFVLSIALLSLRLVASQVFLVIIPLATGIGSLLYITGQKRQLRYATSLPSLPSFISGYLPSFVVVALAALVLTIHAQGGRTLSVYALTGAIGAAIILQIILVDDEDLLPGRILLQLLAAAVIIPISAIYSVPGYVGVDIWTHVPVFIEGILRAESLSTLAGTKYFMAPIYHSIGAVAALVLGDPRNGVYLTMGVLLPISALFIYATGRLFVSARWALLATTFYVFTDQLIRWSMHIIPTSLGLVFFLAIVYFVTKLYFVGPKWWVVGPLVVFSLAIVFTHQVSTAVMLVFLGIAAFVSLITVRSPSTSPQASSSGLTAMTLLGVFVLNLVVTIWSWLNTTFSGEDTFLLNRIDVLRRAIGEAEFLSLASGSDAAGEGVRAGEQSIVSMLAPYVDVLGFGLLLMVAILGGYVMLRWEKPIDASLTHLVAAGVMFVIVFGLSIFGFRALLPGRWMAFMYAPMAIIGAVGVAHLSRNTSTPVMLAIVLVLSLGYPTSMVVAESSSMDSPAFDDTFKRFSYTEQEIAAVTTMQEIRPPTVAAGVNTDHPYRTLFESPGGYSSRILVMNEGSAESDVAVLYRDYQSTGPVTFHLPGEIPRTGFTANYEASSVCSPERNYVYRNDQVILCTPESGGGR